MAAILDVNFQVNWFIADATFYGDSDTVTMTVTAADGMSVDDGRLFFQQNIV